MSAIHLDEATLLRYVVSDVEAKERTRVRRHVTACRRCSESLRSTRKLDKGLRSLGSSLAFDPADPFAERPRPSERLISEFAFSREALSAASTEATEAAPARKASLFEAARLGEEATRSTISSLRMTELTDRFALAHALEESLGQVAAAPRQALTLAEETLRRVSEEPLVSYATAPPTQITLVEYAAPLTDLFGLAHLLAGAAYVWMAEFEKAEKSLTSAYRRFAEGRGSQHHFAWVELHTSQCRSFAGRPEHGLALAGRAATTFKTYGLDLDTARARNAKGIALYYRCRYKEALRELRRAQPVFAEHESWNEFASTMGSIGFALMELGHRKETIDEYAKAVERATRAEALAARSQLQLGIRCMFHNEGEWAKEHGSGPAFHLPAFGGSTYGRIHADVILAAAAEKNGLEKASALIQSLEKEASRGYAYLFFCQMAIGSVPKDPARYVALACKIADATRGLPYRNHRGPAQPVCRESVLADAALLESLALNVQGRSAESREAIRKARENFALADDDSFSTALCDFYEGSAASFEGDYRGAWALLKSALSEFQLYGQQNWVGRSEAALGTMLMNRGNNRPALVFFENALRNLHPELDRTAYATTLMNRGYTLVKLSRLDVAKASYAKALRIARADGLSVWILGIRYGLATIELKRGRNSQALRLFEAISNDARSMELIDRIVTAELRIAECLGRLGRYDDMAARLDVIREAFGRTTDADNQGLLELFAALDKGDLTAGLVAHVAAYVEDLDHGTPVKYQPFRLIAGGRQQ